jgi:hypothetical protein
VPDLLMVNGSDSITVAYPLMANRDDIAASSKNRGR